MLTNDPRWRYLLPALQAAFKAWYTLGFAVSPGKDSLEDRFTATLKHKNDPAQLNLTVGLRPYSEVGNVELQLVVNDIPFMEPVPNLSPDVCKEIIEQSLETQMLSICKLLQHP